MKIGFTGTRHGMTKAQRDAFNWNCIDRGWDDSMTSFHHGDCVGADSDAADLVAVVRDNFKDGQRISIIAHPPIDETHRAFNGKANVTTEAKSHFARNRDIVNETDILIGCPCDATDQQRGGTWYTIHYAQKVGKPVFIIWPDGRIEERPTSSTVTMNDVQDGDA